MFQQFRNFKYICIYIFNFSYYSFVVFLLHLISFSKVWILIYISSVPAFMPRIFFNALNKQTWWILYSWSIQISVRWDYLHCRHFFSFFYLLQSHSKFFCCMYVLFFWKKKNQSLLFFLPTASSHYHFFSCSHLWITDSAGIPINLQHWTLKSATNSSSGRHQRRCRDLRLVCFLCLLSCWQLQSGKIWVVTHTGGKVSVDAPTLDFPPLWVCCNSRFSVKTSWNSIT